MYILLYMGEWLVCSCIINYNTFLLPLSSIQDCKTPHKYIMPGFAKKHMLLLPWCWSSVIVLVDHFVPNREETWKAGRKTLASQHGWEDWGGERRMKEIVFCHVSLCCETSSQIMILFSRMLWMNEHTVMCGSHISYVKYSEFHQVASLLLYYGGNSLLFL